MLKKFEYMGCQRILEGGPHNQAVDEAGEFWEPVSPGRPDVRGMLLPLAPQGRAYRIRHWIL